MSSKRVKQYLMLLTAIGLIAIASGGGSGTFASFTAEVHNPGNTFATGSLYLHDSVTNLAECKSEEAPANSNTSETPNTSGHNCDTLLTVPNSTLAPNGLVDEAGANTTGPLTGTITNIDVTDWNGGTTGLQFGIADGAEVQLDNGTTQDICTVNGAVAQGATTIVVSSCALGAHSYGAGSIVSSHGPFIAHLTLRNAGSIDGSDLKFALDSVSNAGGCDQTVAGLGGSTTLCSHLDFTITEVDNTFSAAVDSTTGDITSGQGCAYGTAASNGCLANSHVMTDVSTQNPTTFSGSWTSLNLFSTGGTNNTRQPVGVDSTLNHATGSGPGDPNADPGTNDSNPGGARYFLVTIWPGDLTNGDQGATATFDIIWHMDQA
jgi:predicted ribosomally synthesized peptide with SipW-like signal peptide